MRRATSGHLAEDTRRGRPHDRRAKGWWQFAVFGLSLVLAWLVWWGPPRRWASPFPEPEESRVGYTAAGCYQRAREHMDWAADARDRQKKAQEYISATRYLEALEERFGVSVGRWDAYEMLGDAERGLASAFEYDRKLARRLRLLPPSDSRAEALRAYRAAVLRLGRDSPDRPRLLRKQAEMLLALGRPAEASGILEDLVKLYRRDEVDRLRRERDEGLPSLTSEAPAALTDEVRTVYFLAGRAALEAARLEKARSARQEDAELQARADTFKRDAVLDFRLFLDAGGAGRRRAEAETALGDLAFARAETKTPAEAMAQTTVEELFQKLKPVYGKGEMDALWSAYLSGDAEGKRDIEATLRMMAALKDAHDHYRNAGTPRAAFLLARVLFRMGDYEGAGKSFARRRAEMSTPEARARSYMEARCLLALGRLDEASERFNEIRAGSGEDAEGASSLVGLARIALASDELDDAARHLLAASASVPRRSAMELPERDRELERPRLGRKLVEIAEAIEEKGNIDWAVEIYRESRKLDEGRSADILGRIARAWERKAESEQPGDACLSAAETYLELADILPSGEARREAMRIAAEQFREGDSVTRAIAVARRFVRDHPEDELASRMLYYLGLWQSELGLSEEAAQHLSENVKLHPSDVYADRSRIEGVHLLVSRGGDEDLRKAREILLEVLTGDGRRRYTAKTLVRLEALFLLGRVDVRLAENTSDEPRKRNLYVEALDVLKEALARGPEDFPASGEKARPRFRELVDHERPRAFVARGVALYGLASIERDARRRLEMFREAAGAFLEAREAGGGERAEFYAALAECGMMEAQGDISWSSATRALASLGRQAHGEGILPAGYWRKWSDWIAERAAEGRTDGGTD